MPARWSSTSGSWESGLESGELHYNLGNAWFRLGELGPAILHYERARRSMPRDDDLAANLALAALADRGSGDAAPGLLALPGRALVDRSAVPSPRSSVRSRWPGW